METKNQNRDFEKEIDTARKGEGQSDTPEAPVDEIDIVPLDEDVDTEGGDTGFEEISDPFPDILLEPEDDDTSVTSSDTGVLLDASDSLDDNDVSEYIAKPTLTYDEVDTREKRTAFMRKFIEAYIEQHQLTDVQVADMVQDAKSIFGQLDRSISGMVPDAHFESLAIAESKDHLTHMDDLRIKSHGPANLDQLTGASTPEGEIPVLHGESATIAAITRIRGLRRLYLFNSGFFVDVRGLSTPELTAFFETVSSEKDILGRMCGGHYYLISDIYIKNKVIGLFEKSIVGSNVKGWKKEGVIRKLLSFQDYKVVVHGLSAMVFDKGIKHSLICTDPKCNKNINTVTLNLDRLRMEDFENVPQRCIELVMAGKPITPDGVKKYQKALGFTRKLTADKYTMDLQVPTIDNYLSYGNQLIGKIAASIQKEELDLTDPLTRVTYQVHLYKNVLPWIRRMELIRADGSVEAVIPKDGMYEILDPSYLEHTTFWRDTQQFIRDTKITHFCHPAQACQTCGTVAKGKDGEPAFIPVDVQTQFFCLSCRRLALTGRD